MGQERNPRLAAGEHFKDDQDGPGQLCGLQAQSCRLLAISGSMEIPRPSQMQLAGKALCCAAGQPGIMQPQPQPPKPPNSLQLMFKTYDSLASREEAGEFWQTRLCQLTGGLLGQKTRGPDGHHSKEHRYLLPCQMCLFPTCFT